MPFLDPAMQTPALSHLHGKLRAMIDADGSGLNRRERGTSEWSVSQHLFHVLKANGYALRNALRISTGEEHRLVTRDAEVREGTLKILRSGTIPRCLADAPGVVTPPAEPSAEELYVLLDLADELTDRVAVQMSAADLSSGFINHPLLGPMDGRMWLRFARIHTEHHMAIIDEILAAAGD